MPLPYAGSSSASPDLATHTPPTKKGRRALNDWRSDMPSRPSLSEGPAPSSSGGGDTFAPAQSLLAPPQPDTILSVEPVNQNPGLFDDSDKLQDILFQAAKQPAVFDPSAVADARSQLQRALNPVNNGSEGLTGARAFVPPPVGQRPQDVEMAQQSLDDALRSQRREALNTNTAGVQSMPGNIKKRTDEMTDEEYNNLDPRQRAAVDFNTMLVDAVRSDRAHQEFYDQNVNPLERRTYDTAVEKMFGEDRGSDLYAPETLAVLRQVFGADEGADPHGALSDYTSLHATIKSKDLSHGVLAPGSPADDPTNARAAEDTNLVENDRQTLIDNLARGTQAMERVLARGQSLLNAPSILTALQYERGQDVGRLGGSVKDLDLLGQQPLGYGQDEVSQYFQKAFDILSDKDNTADKADILGTMNVDLAPDEFKAFLAYADNRSLMATRYKIPLGQGENLVSPDQFRRMLGLDGTTGELGSIEQTPAKQQAPQQGSGY